MKSISDGTAHIIISKELARISLSSMQKLNEKDIIFVFHSLRYLSTGYKLEND